MDLTVRKAQQDDATFLADMIMMAGRNHIGRAILEYILGGKPNDCMTFLQMLLISSTPHLFHHSTYTIAEIGGNPVASMGGYDAKKTGYDALHAAMPEVSPILGWSDAELNMAKERTEKLVPSMPALLDGAWVVDRGATVDNVRRQGVASRLIEEVVAEGKDQGFTKAQGLVYMGNEAGIKLYEKAGFTVNEEKTDEFFEKMIGAPGMVSLTKDI